MPITKVGNINICYKVRGEGKPLLAIAGFASAQNTLFALARYFAKQYQVVTFDNSGVGGSDRPPGTYNMSMMASDSFHNIWRLIASKPVN